MENNNVQRNLENRGNQQQFFYEYVKNKITKLKESNELDTAIKRLISVSTIAFEIDMSVRDFEMLGIFAFLLGADYTGQSYPQEKIVKQVKDRFENVGITSEQLNIILNVFETISNNNFKIENIIKQPIEYLKNQSSKKIDEGIKSEETLLYKNVRVLMLDLINSLTIPVEYAIEVTNIKKEPLTFKNLLKANLLVNETATFNGSAHKKFSAFYGNELVNKLLATAVDYVNDAKFSILYEESIITAVETAQRLGFESITNDKFDFDQARIDFEVAQEAEVEEKKIEEKQLEEAESDGSYNVNYTAAEVEEMMKEHPDLFVFNSLQETLGKYILNAQELVDAVEKQLEKQDFMQHMYQYMGSHLNPKNGQTIRKVGFDTPKGFDNKELDEVCTLLNNKIIECGKKYKELAEYNCKEIPEEQKQQIVNRVDDCIKALILSTPDHKQYLLSQLFENQINTYNQLQQIMSVIESANISAKDANLYSELYDYTKNKSNIEKVFDNGNEISILQYKMSVYKQYRDWFSFHVDIPTYTNDKNTKKSECDCGGECNGQCTCEK